MKTTILKYFLGFASVAFLLIAISTNHFYNQGERLQKIANYTQRVFEEKEKLLKKDLGELQNAIADKNGVLQKYQNFSTFEEDLKKDGFVLIAFQGDSLLFWSDNSFLIPDKKLLEESEHPIIKLENGWYYRHKQKKDSIDLYGFMLIKKIYPYQNKFLKNHFSKDFNIPDSFNVALDDWSALTLEQSSGASVFGPDGKFLFSINVSETDIGTHRGQGKIGLYYTLFLLFFLLFTSVLIRNIQNQKWGMLAILLWGISLVSIRYAMLLWEAPSVFSNLEIFSPTLFARSFFFPSLGEFVINSLFIFLFVYTYSGYFTKNKENFNQPAGLLIWISIHLILFSALYFGISQLFQSLVLDSSISFQMFVFQDNGLYVFVGFFILLLLFYSLGQLAHLIASVASVHWPLKKYFAVVVPILAASTFLTFLLDDSLADLYYLLFPLGLFIFLGLINYREEKGGRYSLFVILLLLVSVFITQRINDFSGKREKQDRLVAAMNLSTEYDPTAENLLVGLQERLSSDVDLKNLCRQPIKNEGRIMDYIQNNYFTGYWEQYYLQITICNANDDLNIEPDNQIRNCFEFFGEMILSTGESIPNTDFYYLNEFDGMVSYLGVISISTSRFGEVKIYLRMDSKVGSEGLGYPDLLLDEKLGLRPVSEDYSYGKYKNGKLIASSGKFNYYFNSTAFGNKTEDVFWKQLDSFDHLVYQFDDNAIVVSCPSVTWYNKVITIPYVFVLLYLFGLVIWLLEKYPWKFRARLSFKYRIQYSIIGLLMLFFILLGGGTVYYTINQANESNNQKLQEKLQLVKRQVTANLQEDNNDTEFLTDRLRQLSNLIYADIHLYDQTGELIASSRPEIFEKKLQERKMNFAAYYQLFFKERTNFIHTENIGDMSYLSVYETLVDEDNKTAAFVNLPYFLKSQELEKEMFNLILAGVNLHVFMILLAIFLSVIISNKITYPLRIIQDRLKATRFGSGGEQIEYSKNDEIGSLVKEYNQMLLELEESAERLARSERESAWREMARQIAHEIKNPLTPMKLSIQFLQKRLEDQTENWEDHFKQVSKTLVEQINTLSSIATAFSNFAQMPAATSEELNLVDILQHSISLFKNDDLDLKLRLNEIETASVFVDREQFVRVFVNLINNAIQSIPDTRSSKVVIELEKAEAYFQISVIDNGTGIDDEAKEKLFYPNFTTKTGGMGLGLAIVKNIVESANGHIRVESELDVGSRFIIKMPQYPGSRK